jgi:hypothetical protein
MGMEFFDALIELRAKLDASKQELLKDFFLGTLEDGWTAKDVDKLAKLLEYDHDENIQTKNQFLLRCSKSLVFSESDRQRWVEQVWNSFGEISELKPTNPTLLVAYRAAVLQAKWDNDSAPIQDCLSKLQNRKSSDFCMVIAKLLMEQMQIDGPTMSGYEDVLDWIKKSSDLQLLNFDRHCALIKFQWLKMTTPLTEFCRYGPSESNAKLLNLCRKELDRTKHLLMWTMSTEADLNNHRVTGEWYHSVLEETIEACAMWMILSASEELKSEFLAAVDPKLIGRIYCAVTELTSKC